MLQVPSIPNLTTCLRSLAAARTCLTNLRSTVVSLTSTNNKVSGLQRERPCFARTRHDDLARRPHRATPAPWRASLPLTATCFPLPSSLHRMQLKTNLANTSKSAALAEKRVA